MVQISNQNDARSLRDLSFCYLCAQPFSRADEINYDHVPPSAVFAAVDRNFPLKFPTHKASCHSVLNHDDEIIGQLVSLIHGSGIREKNDRLRLEIYQRTDNQAMMAAFTQRNLEGLLWRWIRAFHAALYKAPLAETAKFTIQTPFPSGRISDGEFEEDPILEQHFSFVDCIKRNRLANNLDSISCNNGKLRYECVWDRLSDKSLCCVFALKLYDWADLGDVNNFHSRGCAGLYRPDLARLPAGAAVATKLEFRLQNEHKADPFLI